MKQVDFKQKRCGKAISKMILLLAIVTGFSYGIRAQVTIGAGEAPQEYSVLEISTVSTKGGVRLPQLTTAERDAVYNGGRMQSGVAKGEGLAIFNLTTKCYEYWNDSRWVSLCEGDSHMIISPEPCKDIQADGRGCDGEFRVTDPECENGPFSFVIIAGGEYAFLMNADGANGTFNVLFMANNSVRTRSVVVRVTSSCTGLYKDFLFSQLGESCNAALGEAPDITSVPAGKNISICAGGAAYLSVPSSTANPGQLVWTRNNIEIARGVSRITVTQAGIYDVWTGIIGCGQKTGNAVAVTRDGTGSPAPVQLIVTGNNGVACGVGGTVPLVTSPPASGTVIWFHDGVLASETGTQIDAGKGEWFAVVKDSSCYSAPSQVVTVIENANPSVIPAPVMKINGLLNGWKLCSGGSLFLEVGNDMEPGVTYTWYADNTQIGSGSGVYYPVPAASQVVIRLRAVGIGCAREALTVETVSVGRAPDAPFISCNTPGNALCGGQATLSATGGDSYLWFKDGTEIAGQTGSSLAITQTGSYTAAAVSPDGCRSIQSGAIVVTASDFATLGWVNHPAAAIAGQTKTYSVSLDFPQDASYTWGITGGTITNGQGTSSITVNFPSVTTAMVTCTAANACGTALASPLEQAVVVTEGCNDAHITGTGSLTPNITAGNAVALSVTATGTGLAYQWYSGTVGSGSPIAGATSAGYEYTGTTVGTYSFYCIVAPSGGCAPATSQQFTVTVKADPGLIPLGTGIFTGKTCFDIAYSNDNINSCAQLTSRAGHRTDFSLTAAQDPAAGTAIPVYTGTQVYTFTPSGTVSNLRFEYRDASGKVIESLTPEGDYTGSINPGTACKVAVKYKPSLNTDLRGLTRFNALTAQLYAVYYNNAPGGAGTDAAVKLNLTLGDCACCGAATTTGSWLTFMCHNLGADESLDPYTYVSNGDRFGNDIKGDLYQWGRPKDGHQLRASYATVTLATNTIPGHSNFIINDSAPYDWHSGSGGTSRWGDGTTNENMDKAVNDPCPAGWKVPSQKQWASIYANAVTPNTWTWTGNGYKIGDALYLPAAGSRNVIDGSVILVGSSGVYWTSNSSSPSVLSFNSSSVFPANNYPKANGFSVRCVAE